MCVASILSELVGKVLDVSLKQGTYQWKNVTGLL